VKKAPSASVAVKQARRKLALSILAAGAGCLLALLIAFFHRLWFELLPEIPVEAWLGGGVTALVLAGFVWAVGWASRELGL
jgi:hypothetical protein